MNLLNYLDESKKVDTDKRNHEIYLSFLKRLYFDLDICGDALVYIWTDDNRVKFSMDGFEKFKIKKGTKFSHMPIDYLSDDKFKKHIESQINDILNPLGIFIYKFYMEEDKLIFKVKNFKKIKFENLI